MAVRQHEVTIVGAMKDAMWKGELFGKVQLDTLPKKAPLFGIGPVAYMRGEIMLLDGKTYVSEVTSDSTMSVSIIPEVAAPFFVYAEVSEWEEIVIPFEVKTLQDIENFLVKNTATRNQPVPFMVKGSVSQATIHVQNLPEGTKVTSPQEAHQGQVSYKITDAPVTMVGFFSEEHQGVFTHHDTFLHIHLLNDEQDMMGHLDAVSLKKARLFLPKGLSDNITPK